MDLVCYLTRKYLNTLYAAQLLLTHRLSDSISTVSKKCVVIIFHFFSLSQYPLFSGLQVSSCDIIWHFHRISVQCFEGTCCEIFGLIFLEPISVSQAREGVSFCEPLHIQDGSWKGISFNCLEVYIPTTYSPLHWLLVKWFYSGIVAYCQSKSRHGRVSAFAGWSYSMG